MLWIDPRLSDWDSDMMRVIGYAHSELKVVTIKINTPTITLCVDACMNPKDLPEYMQPLTDDDDIKV